MLDKLTQKDAPYFSIKPIILTGDDKEGKTKLISRLSYYNDNRTVRIGRLYSDKKNNYWHQFIEKDTKVIVFENINIDSLEKYLEIATVGITVQRHETSKPFTIFPLIIFDVLTCRAMPQGASYTRRFDFINLTKREI